jgi:hypothetical protein
MLLCKYCDYFEEMKKTTESGNEVSVCHFTDHLFMKDVEMLDIEHPCKDVSFQDYLESLNSVTVQATA